MEQTANNDSGTATLQSAIKQTHSIGRKVTRATTEQEDDNGSVCVSTNDGRYAASECEYYFLYPNIYSFLHIH